LLSFSGSDRTKRLRKKLDDQEPTSFVRSLKNGVSEMAEQHHDPPRPEAQPGAEEIGHSPLALPAQETQATTQSAARALTEGLREIKTPEQAADVADEVLATTGDTTEQQVREHDGGVAQPEQAIQAAAALAPEGEKAPAVLIEAAEQVAGSAGETREALESGLQRATNPAQQGAVDLTTQKPLDLLRTALLERMKPYQALDVRLFLAVNHLPHTPLLNGIMYAVTLIMTSGFGWVLGLLVATLLDRPRGRQALLQTLPPLWFATMTVEYPIKYYFRRKRPFIDIVQAIAVGRKLGSYSFPSGHSASAFAGAWLLRRHYPRLVPLWYGLAALTGFSRVYLGAHYPGDVLSGAISGTVIAEATRWMIDAGDASMVERNPLKRAWQRWH
jgi:undecaprenyl-diphosphatase